MTFSLYENSLFSFYKPNSIFKTKNAFYGNKFSKSRCFSFFFIGIIDFFKWPSTNYFILRKLIIKINKYLGFYLDKKQIKNKSPPPTDFSPP